MTASLSRSALRPLTILEVFRTAGRPLSLTELSHLANIPLSTCHSVVHSLEQYGLLYFLSSGEAYPTRRLWDLARDIYMNDPVATRCLPALTALRDTTKETVILGTQQDDRILYLLVVESEQSIRYSSRAGDFKPMHSSSIGKVLLSLMPVNELELWLSKHELSRATDSTITSKESLKKDLEQVRFNGYSITRGENVADVMAIAAPLQLGDLTLGLAVAGPLERMNAQTSAVSTALLSCTQGLSDG